MTSSTHTIQAQAPRRRRQSLKRCACCRRATEASELLCFLFCPNCYAIIYSEIEAALARDEIPGRGNPEKARATGNGCTGMGPAQGGVVPYKTPAVMLR